MYVFYIELYILTFIDITTHYREFRLIFMINGNIYLLLTYSMYHPFNLNNIELITVQIFPLLSHSFIGFYYLSFYLLFLLIMFFFLRTILF